MLDDKEYVVGVDLGGTKILSAVFTSRLKCLGRAKRRTKADREPLEVIDRIASCVMEAIRECDVDPKLCRGVGIGAPGAVDFGAGSIIFAPNLGWRDVALKRELGKRLKVPVFVDNDCNVATLGVHEKELDGKPKILVGMFVGTGIGGGIVINGRPYSGTGGTAGEIGHMVVLADGPRCGCWRKGCLEAVGSRTAMLNTFRSAVKNGEKTLLLDIVGSDLSKLKSSHLRKALRKGDRLVKQTIDTAARYIGIGAANLINVLNPDHLVVGGGVVSSLGDEMFEPIRSAAQEYIFPGADTGLKIIPSRLGDDAGITGAAVLAMKHLE